MLKQLTLIFIIFGFAYSAESTSQLVPSNLDDCAGTLTYTECTDFVSTGNKQWFKLDTANSAQQQFEFVTGNELDLSQVYIGGVYNFWCIGTDADGNTCRSSQNSFELSSCKYDVPLTQSEVTGCEGTLTAAIHSSYTSGTYSWSYSLDGGDFIPTNVDSETFEYSVLPIGGTYDIQVDIVTNDNDELTGVYEDVTVSECTSETAVITVTDEITECTGLLTASIEVDSGFVVSEYAWTYTLSGQTGIDSLSTEDTFDIAQITVDGTYSIKVTLTNADGDMQTQTKSDVVLSGCSAVQDDDDDDPADDDDDDDDDSSKILGIFILYFIALLF